MIAFTEIASEPLFHAETHQPLQSLVDVKEAWLPAY